MTSISRTIDTPQISLKTSWPLCFMQWPWVFRLHKSCIHEYLSFTRYQMEPRVWLSGEYDPDSQNGHECQVDIHFQFILSKQTRPFSTIAQTPCKSPCTDTKDNKKRSVSLSETPCSRTRYRWNASWIIHESEESLVKTPTATAWSKT